MHQFAVLWGFRLTLLLFSGEATESERMSSEHFSLDGPSFEARPLGPSRESLETMPPWMREEPDDLGFLSAGTSCREAAPIGARPGTAAARSLFAQDPKTPGPNSGERTPDPPAPQAKEESFAPPHASWSGVGQHFSSQAWKNDVWNDYLATPEVLLPIGLAVSAAAISHWDKTLERHWQGLLGNHRSYSDIGQDALIGLVVLDGILLPGEGRNWWDEVWTIGEAYAASSLTVYVLKSTVQRPRPGGASGVGTHSFPSGHSQGAFTAATLIERNSGPLFGLPSYGLAAFTAFQRVEEGHHYPSDILAGAAIGVLSASIFDSLHWGSGPGDGGIARPGVAAKVGFLDGLHGFSFELGFGF